MMQEADFDSWSGNFFKFETDKQYEVVFANWRKELRTYSESEGEKPVLVFDVLKVNGGEVTDKKLVWSTRSRQFINTVKPFLLRAQERGLTAVRLLVRYLPDKSYMVMSPE